MVLSALLALFALLVLFAQLVLFALLELLALFALEFSCDFSYRLSEVSVYIYKVLYRIAGVENGCVVFASNLGAYG